MTRTADWRTVVEWERAGGGALEESVTSVVASGNQASDDKGQGPGYQIGELDLGAKPRRGPSGEVAAVEAARTSGMQPAAQAVPRPAAAAQAPAAQAPAASQAQQAALAMQQAQQLAAQAQAVLAQARALTAQGQQLTAAQQQTVAAAQAQLAHAEKIARVAAQAMQGQRGSQTGLAPVGERASQVGLEPVQPALAGESRPANQQTQAREKGLGQSGPFEDEPAPGPSLELEIDASALRPTAKKGAEAKGGKPAAAPAAKAGASPLPAKPATAKPGAPAKPAQDMTAFGSKEMGDGFGEPEDGPALELESIERKADRVAAKGTDAKSVDKAELAKEEQAARELGGFGDGPENIVESVKYAVHVARRLLVLKKEREKATLDYKGLEGDYHTALVEMGQALMAMQTDPKTAPLRSRIAAVLDANHKVTSADQTMSKTREANLQAVQRLEKEAEDLRTSLQPFMEAEQAAERAHKRCDDEVKRAEAHIKRAEIELRSAIEAKSEDNTKVEDARAALELRKISLNDLENARAQAAQVLGLKRKELAVQRGTLDSLEEKKKALLEEAKKREAEVEQHAKEAEGTQAVALRGLALYCIEQKLQELVADRYEWVKEVESACGEAKKVVVRYDRALTMYERNEVIKGFGVVGGFAFVVIALLVFLAVS
jgi:colicin import membrane protein